MALSWEVAAEVFDHCVRDGYQAIFVTFTMPHPSLGFVSPDIMDGE